ncbi:hypothetical protein NP233_g6054 [Leucocoprinus birnbaumii]|uniref:Integrase core domain-containing protein n=1 Tax=Leucocoprinus birnbaumii TaxID=56174 RepID=A0AAD5VXC0_9AGAR|nr:hypothetical protein NP233_g6054 [Leucocoprinus birnbaumii]
MEKSLSFPSPIMAAATNTHNRIFEFLQQTNTIFSDARHLTSTLPNVERFAVERSLRLLHAVKAVSTRLGNQLSSAEDISLLHKIADSLILPLQHYLDTTEENPRPQASTIPSDGTQGRPRFIIDLEHALHLHNLGNTWKSIAEATGVSRCTLYRHLNIAGVSPARPVQTEITDETLDEIVSLFSLQHPQNGAYIVQGHLRSLNINIPIQRVKDSLKRVDPVGSLLRHHGAIKRRIYSVRGSNALWHMDGNEKLRPWGFYVHGCIDGHSRMVIYLECRDNKRAATVERIFMQGVNQNGWPSRMRGDYGTENNGVEMRMITKWGDMHKAFIRGRSVHNVRIERLWRDHFLNDFKAFWNHHSLRTASNKTPIAIYELSKTKAINLGYWNNDPGDAASSVDGLYGFDGEETPVPEAELLREHDYQSGRDSDDGPALAEARNVLNGLPVDSDDGNHGINWYCQAILMLQAYVDNLS